MNKLFTKVASVTLGLALALGIGVAVASHKDAAKVDAAVNDETVLFDVTNKANWGTSNSTYSATEWTDSTQPCTFAFAANNNKGWAYVRMGGKKQSNTDSYIKCNTATTKLTSSVKVTVAQAKSNASLTLNSVKLFVYSDSFSTKVDEISYDLNDYTAKTISFTPSSTYLDEHSGKIGSNWAIGSRFKYVINWTNTADKNYGSDISKIVAVEGAAPSTTKCASIHLTNYPTSDFGIGETAQLGYTAVDENEDEWSGLVTYASSDVNVATVSESGLLTAVGIGTTTVSVQDKAKNATADEHLVTVLPNYFYPVTSQDDLINGAKIVIIGKDGDNYFEMNDTISSYKPGTTAVSHIVYNEKEVIVPTPALTTWTVGLNQNSFTLLSNNAIVKYLRGYVYNKTTPEIVTTATASNTGNSWTLSANSTTGYNLVSDDGVYAYLASSTTFDGTNVEPSEGVYVYQLCKGTPAITKVVPSTNSISVNSSSGADTFTFDTYPSYAVGTATAVSGNTDVVTVSTTGTTVTVTPVGDGNTTITFKDANENVLAGSVTASSTIVVSYDSLRVEGELGGAPYYIDDVITAEMMSGISVYGVKAGQADTLLVSGYTLTPNPAVLDTVGSVNVTITATYDANPEITGSKVFNITVNDKDYAAKASLSDLWDGQVVYFGNNSDRAWGLYSTGNNVQAASGTGVYHESKGLSITDSSNARPYLVGRIYDEDAELVYYSFSYVKDEKTYYLASTASGSNELKGVLSLDNSCYWIISEGEAAGQFSIKNVKNTGRYLQNNGNYLSCYLKNQTDPYLYVATEYSVSEVAGSFKQNALHFKDYNPDGYPGWCSDSEHGYYANAKKVWNAMSKDEQGALDELGLARLSAWATANGDVLVDNGSGSYIIKSGSSRLPTGGLKETTMGIIIAISVITTIGIGAVIVLHKKKRIR